MTSPAPSRARHSRALPLAVLTVCTLVLCRSLVFVVYPHAFFDSDQAIVGLMAKHLAEGRAFPLFFYGQQYLLGVEAWLAVPWFWMFGATATALKLSLLASNLLVAALIVVGLHRHAGVAPGHAVIASMFFAFAPVATSARLLEAMGGNIEPFVFIVVLWWLRGRPLWFGSVLAIGFLTREFAIYAVPALLAPELVKRRLWQKETVRHWLLALVAFLVVSDAVLALRPLADLRGPGTRGQVASEPAGAQVSNLTGRIAIRPAEWPGRVIEAARHTLPDLVGARDLDDDPPVGHEWFPLMLGLGAVLACGRVAWLSLGKHGGPRADDGPFAWYLFGVGVVAIAVFIATRPVENAPLRYVLLAILAPVGLTATWLKLEPERAVRLVITLAVSAWAIWAGAGHAGYAARFTGGREPDRLGALAGALEARGVQVAEAEYWRAYRLTFLSGERVIVASSDYVRIDAYQRRLDESGHAAPRLQEAPCDGGTPVAGWHLCPR